MNVPIFRAWLLGTGVLLFAHVIWFAVLESGSYSELAVSVFWLSPLLAALVSAFMAPRWKLVAGMSMSPTLALLVVILKSVYQSRGVAVDFPGAGGGLILFCVTLAYGMVLSGLRSISGLALARKLRTASRLRGTHGSS